MSSINFICPVFKKINRLPKKDSYKKANYSGCGNSLLNAKPIEAKDSDFDYIINNSTAPVIVDFWASWCGPCRMMAPNFEAASIELSPKTQFVKVNTEEAQQVASRFAIRSIPTIIVFKYGKEAERVSGALPNEQILALASKYI